MKHLLSTLAVAITPALTMAGVEAVDIEREQSRMNMNLPVVPVSAIVDAENKALADTKKAKQANSQAVNVADPDPEPEPEPERKTKTEKNAKQSPGESRFIKVKPGVNEVVPISVGHANRISFPFDSPKIRTTSTANFDVEENILHLSSSQLDKPITVFVTDASDPQSAMSLTFVPRRIPPVDLVMQFEEGYLKSGYRSTAKAEKWEISQPYIQTIRQLLREVAIGAIPDGYSLDLTPNLSNFSGCKQSGLEFDWRQAQNLEGHNLAVTIGSVRNVSTQLIEFRESSCAAIDVRAVATHPNPLLMPGASSEVYIVRSEPIPLVDPSRARPRLVGGAQ